MSTPSKSLDGQELLRHLDWVRALARELVRDAHTAEDVVQETFRLALEHPPRTRENPRGWLGTVARHVAASLGRARARRDERERGAARDEARASSAELAAEAELARALATAVLELDEPYRSVIVLRYFRDASPAAIARQRGASVNTVRSQLARGLAALRAKLDRSRGGRASWLAALAPLASAPPSGSAVPLAGAKAWLAAAAVLALGVASARIALRRHADGYAGAPPLALDGPSVADASGPGASPVGALEPGPGGEGRARVAAAASRTEASELGVLELDVREPDGTPAADLAYVVFCERRGDRLMAQGATDGRGRATCRDLPEDVYLISTERRGAAAAGSRGVWLARGTTQRVELELSGGGAVHGRVVDDLGVARAGVEVTVPGGPAAWQHVNGLAACPPVVVAVTDDEGRFRVEHLRAFAKGVWIVDGEERPEQRFDATLTARDPRFPEWSSAAFDAATVDGEDRGLPDVVLPRVCELAGAVVDDRGEPVVGALVSAEPARSSEVMGVGRVPTPEFRPGAAGFVLRAGEALSDARGAFAVACPASSYPGWLATVTPEGLRASVQHGPVPPGARLDGLRVVVARGELVALELVDASGAPVELVSARSAARRVELYGRHRFTSAFAEIELGFTFEDGNRRSDRVAPDPDGRVRLALGRDPRDVRALEVAAPGWTTRAVALPAGLDPGALLRVELDPLPSLRVALAWEDGRWPAALEGVHVHACRLETVPRSVDGLRVECCGLGSSLGRERASWGEPFELPVASREPYFLHVTGRGSGGALAPQRFGPFAPGPDVHVLELDGEMRPQASTAPRPERAPPPRGAAAARAVVSVRAVDAQDGRELAWRLDARAPGTEWGALGGWSGFSASSAPPTLSAGTWEFQLTSDRHRPLALGARAVEPGGRLDLGTQRLAPFPVLRGRFALPDGTPWGEGASVSAGHAWGAVDGAGRFELAGDLDGDVVLAVQEQHAPARAGLGTLSRGANALVLGTRWYTVTGWREGEERVLDAPVFRPVVVRVNGLSPEHRDATLGVRARGEFGGAERRFDGVEDPFAAERTFRFRLAPGRYRLEAVSPLSPIAPRAFEVLPGAEPLALELSPE